LGKGRNLQSTPSNHDVGERLGKKAEVWSLGVVAFELLMGRSPSRFDFSDDVRNDYIAFANDLNNRALDVRDENGNVIRQGYFGTTTGYPEVDDLINQLLHPDPTQRPTPQQVANHPAFKLGFFDSDIGHALVEQLMQPG
jgi:serine/threonine protein kinase